MASRPILQLGHRILRNVSKDVPSDAFGTSTLRNLVQEMKAAMTEDDGCGLAAPQLGEPLRLFVVEMPQLEGADELQPIPFTVFANPVLNLHDGRKMHVWESCLSVPGLAGLVPRARRATIEFQDIDGRRHRAQATGFLAAILQHEYDHLDGLVFLNRMPPETLVSNLVAKTELDHLPPDRFEDGVFKGTFSQELL